MRSTAAEELPVTCATRDDRAWVANRDRNVAAVARPIEPPIWRNKELSPVASAIWWRGIEEVEQTPTPNQRIDLAYELEGNRWNGDIRLQLNVKDLRNSKN